ncbi:hypothetical protein ACTXKO_12980, partial [Corynebacterium casei]|uniref:hypothetical protein n=1 Tax=Corynebacterium casei TaxID=160386 RepID=UPI003FD14D0E
NDREATSSSSEQKTPRQRFSNEPWLRYPENSENMQDCENHITLETNESWQMVSQCVSLRGCCRLRHENLEIITELSIYSRFVD